MAGAQAEPAAPKRMSRGLQWLARRRVALGFICAAVAFWFARPTPRSLTIGSAIAVAGELVRIWAAGHLEKGREVTVSGPYRFLRHPLYAGSSLIGAGIAVACASVAVALLTAAYLSVTLMAAISTEERHLTEKFGETYPEYRRGRAGGAPRAFSASRAMRNREYRAVGGLLAALALLAWKTL
jgi:protein-S-isoprenylcysteine O-methyltransferase Ste14